MGFTGRRVQDTDAEHEGEEPFWRGYALRHVHLGGLNMWFLAGFIVGGIVGMVLMALIAGKEGKDAGSD